MISIRKENPKHQENALIVEREVILEKNVKLRPNPLSTPLLVTKPVRKRSSNS